MDEMNTAAAQEELPRKRGYYSRALTGRMLINYEVGMAQEGDLDDEINFMRMVLVEMIHEGIQFVHMRLYIAACNCLKGLYKTRRTVFKKDDKNALAESVEDVFRKIGLASGIPIERWMNNPLRDQFEASRNPS